MVWCQFSVKILIQKVLILLRECISTSSTELCKNNLPMKILKLKKKKGSKTLVSSINHFLILLRYFCCKIKVLNYGLQSLPSPLVFAFNFSIFCWAKQCWWKGGGHNLFPNLCNGKQRPYSYFLWTLSALNEQSSPLESTSLRMQSSLFR